MKKYLIASTVLAMTLAVQAHAVPDFSTPDLSTELTNSASASLEAMGIAPGRDAAMVAIDTAIDLTKTPDPAMVAINTAIDLTKAPSYGMALAAFNPGMTGLAYLPNSAFKQAHVYNCPQPASVKPDTCSIHRKVATRANKLSAELTNGASKVLESMGIAAGRDRPVLHVAKGPVGGKFPLAGS